MTKKSWPCEQAKLNWITSQVVILDELGSREFFGFASMMEQTKHQTTAVALENTECIGIDRQDISVLQPHKPMAGLDLLDRR